METFYARVMTKYGNGVHLTEVEAQHRPVDVEGRKTLCNCEVEMSMDGCADPVDCKKCSKHAAENPKRMR
jgi:hypothetical protein